MMTRKRRATSYESGPNLTPLVDVVLVVPRTPAAESTLEGTLA